jgi:hypothetical protein
VGGILVSSYRQQITTHDLQVIVVVTLIVAGLGICQLKNWIKRLRRGERGVGWRIALALGLDAIIFFSLLAGHLALDYYLSGLAAPKNVEYERVTEDLVKIHWTTRDATKGMLIWGTTPGHLQNIAAVSEVPTEATEHEILLDVPSGRTVYFKLMVGENEYGLSNGTPYEITAVPAYQLQEIKVNEGKKP